MCCVPSICILGFNLVWEVIDYILGFNLVWEVIDYILGFILFGR